MQNFGQNILLFSLIFFISCASDSRKFEELREQIKRTNYCSFEEMYYRGVSYPIVLDTSKVSLYIEYFSKDLSDSLVERLLSISCDITKCINDGEKNCDKIFFNTVQLVPAKLDTLNIWVMSRDTTKETSFSYYKIKDGPIKKIDRLKLILTNEN